MNDPKANALIQDIKKTLDKGFDVETLAAQLKELRPYALKEEDPLVTKTIRLIYEHIEEENEFQFVLTPDEEDEEEGIEPMEMGTDTENLAYLMDLLVKSDNKFNREEIKDYRTQLKEF